MNKKGFTLVEVLAVIVIMSVILLIAIPNVVEAINNSKKKAFETEVSTMYSTAKAQYNLDKSQGKVHFFGTADARFVLYCDKYLGYGATACEGALKLKNTSDKGYYYYIRLDVNGEINHMIIGDGRFEYQCFGVTECLTVNSNTIYDAAAAPSPTPMSN